MNLNFEMIAIVAACAIIAEVWLIAVVPTTDGLVFLYNNEAEEQG